jgi:hypothetical protein
MQNYLRYLENNLTHFHKLSDGSVGSRMVIFYVRTMIDPGDRPRVFRIEFNQDHFRAAIAPELSKENSNSKRIVDKSELIEHTDNSVCNNWRMIQGHFARQTMTRTPHPVYSPDLSPSDFRFFGDAEEQLKDQLVTDESELDGTLTDIWERIS